MGLNPEYAPAHYNLGDALMALGQENAALMHYHISLITEPENSRVYNNIGIILAKKNKIADAIANF